MIVTPTNTNKAHSESDNDVTGYCKRVGDHAYHISKLARIKINLSINGKYGLASLPAVSLIILAYKFVYHFCK